MKQVFLFDVDNTLLDNDRVIADLNEHLGREIDCQQRYWEIFEQLRSDLGYADYLGALQIYRANYPRDLRVLTVSHFLLEYPFADRLYPNALQVVQHASQVSKSVILSDGDVVFQPHKVRRSGLYDAFAGAVLIYVHKEFELEDVERRYPAERYVLIDDKVRILSAVKRIWGQRVTTVFVRQGHYALDPTLASGFPAPDLTIRAISDLLNLDLAFDQALRA